MNMYTMQTAKQHVLTELKKAVGKEFTPSIEDLAVPPDAALGDLAFKCFALAKGMGRNPAEVASELAAKMAPKGLFKTIAAHGPYVNFFFDDAAFAGALLPEILDAGPAYGLSTVGAGKTVMVEYANPNTHKEIHVGHLRNFFVGHMTVNVLRANGYTVIPVSYINDLGAHVAAVIWAVRGQASLPTKDMDANRWLGEMYVEAVRAMDGDPNVKQQVSDIHRLLETQKKSPELALWKKTRAWSLKYLRGVFKELGLPIEASYLESELIRETKKIVADLKKKGIAVESQGAVIVDLSEEKLGVNLLVKSDGNLLYNAKDLALALRKEHEFHPQRSLYVIDVRQALAMNQLFATLKRMGFEKELAHISYEFVTLKEGAMAARKGNVIRYEAFRDAMFELARTETRARHAEWKEKHVDQTAATLVRAAMRFSMLKQDVDKKITFDMNEALSFDGATGPYLLYCYARIQSILKKAKGIKPLPAGKHLKTAPEHRLLILLASYPETVFQVAVTLHLSAIAQSAFDLCRAFSEFYEAVPVLQAEGTEIVAERLALVQAVACVLENAFGLLGIEPMKEM